MTTPANREPTILLEKRGLIGYITFNRPEVLNALRFAEYALLDDYINDCDRDENLRAVIITGKGRAWSVGEDINMHRKDAPEEDLAGDPLARAIAEGQLLKARTSGYRFPTQRSCLTMLNSSKIFIAASNGINYIPEYLYAMDFVVAAENSTFAQADVRLGFNPAGGSTQLAPRALGRRRATELLLLCDLISAQEACRLGLVNRVVPEERLMAEAEAIAHKIMDYSMSAIQLTKQLLTKADELALDDGLRLEQMYAEQAMTSGENQAFAERFFARGDDGVSRRES